MGLNPSSADQLKFCTDDQFNKGNRQAVACPAASKIGTVAIETPPLPAGSLAGSVFLGKQLSRNPTSGDEYRIFVDAESSRYGVSVRLLGKVSADPKTGRLTTTFAENPQVPFTSFKLSFEKGNKAVLTSAPSCGPNTSSAQITPYTRNGRRETEPGVHPDRRRRRRALSENARRTALRAGLLDLLAERQGRRLQHLRRPLHPQGRRTGDQRRRHRPAAGRDGQAQGRPVLLGERPGPGGRARRRGGAQTAELSRQEPRRVLVDQSRQRRLADPDRRQCLSRRPLRRRAALPGRDHPGGRRSLRPRHGRRPGADARRSRNGTNPSRRRRDSRRLRRRQARPPLGQHQRRQEGIHHQPDRLPEIDDRRLAARRRRRPDQPGDLRQRPRLGAFPGPGLQATALPAALLGATLRLPQRHVPEPQPEVPGGRRRPPRRRKPTPRERLPAAAHHPRPASHRHALHPAPAGGRAVPESVGQRLRPREVAAARRGTEGARLPGARQSRPARPAGRPARPGRTSACAARRRRSTAACATPST